MLNNISKRHIVSIVMLLFIVFLLYYITIYNRRKLLQEENYNLSKDKGLKTPLIAEKPPHMYPKTSLTQSFFNAVSNLVHEAEYDKHIIVHIDLKGAPPKMPYLKNFLKLIKSMGTTGILVEYEDMFPFTGELQSLSAYNAYTSMEIKELYSHARNLELEFIPLIQTFGHLEFLLKLKEFSHLREAPMYPSAICPTKNGSMPVLQLMIKQILKLHPGIKRLHIGSDEVFQLGECEACQKKLWSKDWSKDDLFVNHVAEVAKYVKTFKIIPIMWDDMLRKTPIEIIRSTGIQNMVELMVWKYSPGIMESIQNNIWDKYAEFSNIWMASAFKGAEKPDYFITDITKRIENNKEWMEVYHMLSASIHFNGIVLTGWQRFDHFAALCELLPQAVPALELSIDCIKSNKMDHDTIIKVGNHLECDGFLNTDLKYIEYINDCNYPGAEILKISQKLYLLKRDVQNMLQTNYVRGWVSKYNIKYNFASPNYIEMAFQNLPILRLECQKLIDETKKAMSEVYDEYTINEWMSQHLYPLQQQLDDLQDKKNLFLRQSHWRRNPQEYGFKTDL